MQCPNCYDEEATHSGYRSIVKRIYLEMEEVGSDNVYEYYQCPRCTMTRKKKMKFFSSGVIEGSTPEEAKEAVENSSTTLGTAIGVVGIGIATIILAGALLSDSDKKK